MAERASKAKARAVSKSLSPSPRPGAKRKRHTAAGRPLGVTAKVRRYDMHDATASARRNKRNDDAVRRADTRARQRLASELTSAAAAAEAAAADAERTAAELEAREALRQKRAELHADRIKALSPHAQGAPAGENTKKATLLGVFGLMFELEIERTSAICMWARICGSTARSIAAIVDEYDPMGQGLDCPVYSADDGHVRRGVPSPQKQTLTPAMSAFCKGLVESQRRKGGTLSLPDVREALVLEYGDESVPSSDSTLRRRLYELGIYTLPVKSMPKRLRTDTAAWRQREVLFLTAYAKALALQRDGKAIIVYLDESFVHVGHRRGSTLCDVNAAGSTIKPHRSGLKAVVQSGTGRGRMLIILNAITRDGLLCTRTADGKHFRVKEGATGEQLSCERVWASGGKGTDDYHASMDGEMFELYLRQQLIPTARARYPGLRIILSMDNAPSHRRWADDHKNPTTASKPVCHAELTANGVNSLSVERDGKTVLLRSERWLARAPVGAYGDELQMRLQRLYQLKPWLNRTRVDELLTAAARSDNGDASIPDDRYHYTVFTLPYDTDAQPIERLWSYAKQHVAARYTAGRTLDTVRAQLLDGFYGDGKRHEPVGAEHVQRWISAAHEHMSKRLRSCPTLRAMFGAAARDEEVTIERLTPDMCAAHKRLHPIRYDLLDDGVVLDGYGDSDDDEAVPADGAAPSAAAASAADAARSAAPVAARSAAKPAAAAAAAAASSLAAAAARNSAAPPKRRAAPRAKGKKSAKSKERISLHS
jgi:hypothetical protein